MKSLFLFLLMSVSALSNAAIIYDEAIDGDANSTGGSGLVGADVGALLLGDNTIVGSRETGDFDDYIFEISSDLTLLNISFTSVLGIDSWAADLYTDTGTLVAAFNPGALAAGVTTSAFGSALPLSTGIYRIDHNFAGGTIDYSWTLTTRPSQAVPEPAPIALLALGLLALGLRKRLS